jgi:dTDP-4-dehydrorhamnose 3,5-epimerase
VQFEPLKVLGAFCVRPDKLVDERGFFARTFCSDEFSAQGLAAEFKQSSTSFNPRRGTVRGIHFSAPPFEETKVVRCTTGVIFDVIIDLRSGSETYLQSQSITLSCENSLALYIPTGVAHGFQTVADNSEVLYMIDTPFNPSGARGIRWNDPAISIRWPEAITMIADRDLSFPDWSAQISNSRCMLFREL